MWLMLIYLSFMKGTSSSPSNDPSARDSRGLVPMHQNSIGLFRVANLSILRGQNTIPAVMACFFFAAVC